MEAKFKVGDFVMPALDPSGLTKCQIVEIHKQECPARIEQITYLCRIGAKTFYRGTPVLTKDYFLFNEIELLEYKEPEKMAQDSLYKKAGRNFRHGQLEGGER